MLRAQVGLVQRIYLSVFAADGTTGSGLQALPTITIRSARDAADIVTAASTVAAGAGIYYYDLQPTTATSQIDTLTAVWSYTYESAAQSQTDEIAVVGQRLAGLQSVDDTLNRGGSSDDYQARRKDLALQAAEAAIEAECLKVFTTQYGSALIDGDGCRDTVTLPDYPVQSLIAVSVDDTAVDVADLTLYGDTGRVYSANRVWTTGKQNIAASYVRGVTSVPWDVSRAVSLIASSLLADGPWDDRGFGVTTDGGFVRLLTAGVGSTAFSIPEVQATVNRHRRTKSEQLLAQG